MSLLSDEEIAAALVESPWERDGAAIPRDVELPDFAAAIALVNRRARSTA